jgi:hypothetical protein
VTPAARHPGSARGFGALALWLAVAAILGASGRLEGLRPPMPQLVIVGLSVALLVASSRVDWVRRWLRSLDSRWLVAVHLTRFVGVYFLVLAGRGELPRAFAVPAGWGDIAVAAGALLLVATGSLEGGRRRLLLGWNTVGFLDIALVVINAARLWVAEPGSMAALLRLPLSLLPTFVVPLVIATHVLLFRRAMADAAVEERLKAA